MIRKLLSQLAFCIFLVMGLSCSFAFAEEVVLVPSDSWEYQVHFQSSAKDFYITTDSTMDYPASYTDPFYPSHRLILGDFLCGSSQVAYVQGYNPSVDTPGYSPSPYSYQGCYPYYFIINSYNTPVDFPAFSLSFHESTLSLDCSNLTAGWYRYEVEFYLGVAVGGYGTFTPAPPSFEPTFTYLTDEIPLGVNGVIYYAGTEDISTGDVSSPMFGTKLVHFHFEDTFEVDPEVGSYDWNVAPAFQYLISGLQYQGFSVLKRQGIAVYGNSRFASSLYGNVEPIVSPTPSPTPYPGQDTQESINSGVQQIVQDLNVYATPIPTPADLTIDETVVDVLETMTLPDLTDSEATFSSLWEIFTPAVWFLALMASSIFIVSIFLWILRGGWL